MRRHGHRKSVSAVELPSVLGLDQVDVSLLDVIDHVLNQGIVISGELTLGVADVDLICVRLLALICSADRVAGVPANATPRGSRKNRGA
jgi:Gas vesicle protein